MTVRQGSVAVVANPVGAKEQSDALRQALSDGGVDVTWRETTEDDPGVGQSKQCVDDGANVGSACGGGGRVRADVGSLAGPDGMGSLPEERSTAPSTEDGVGSTWGT